jgi:tRNA dimethylallyltransferase
LTSTLIILLGPTGVGKTQLSLTIANRFNAPIISADSRQIYKDIPIGTAAPTEKEKTGATHYMVGTHELTDYYSAAQFETDVIALLSNIFAKTNTAILCGGSMMYIDAIAKGIDDIPTIQPGIRNAIYRQYEKEGLEHILEELAALDPIHYNTVDRKNHKRVIHALEICRQTGQPYSSFRKQQTKQRPFNIIKTGLIRSREELDQRINNRVDQMIASGIINEARQVYHLRHHNSLNTVGYKELFAYFDGAITLEHAIEKIKRNTRHYSRKQMTWFKRDKDITWFNPDDTENIIKHIETTMK